MAGWRGSPTERVTSRSPKPKDSLQRSSLLLSETHDAAHRLPASLVEE